MLPKPVAIVMELLSIYLVAFLLPLAWAQTLPLSSTSRWIVDAKGDRVKFRCANWPGHLNANIPEGLSSQKLDIIVNWLADQGFNCVRLTYSIDMALAPNVSVSDSFLEGAKSAGINVTEFMNVYNTAVRLNPFLANSTRLEVFGNVIDALWNKGVMTVLDNHVSKAVWCCNYTDGNGWWDTASGIYNAGNQRYFNTTNWLAGLKAMAIWAKDHKGVVAMSLRNEMRQLPLVNTVDDWYKYVEQAATLIHSNNADVLVVVGGVLGGMDLMQLKRKSLNTTGWSGKNVWEFHAYEFSVLYKIFGYGHCSRVKDLWGMYAGFVLEQEKSWTGPLWLSEFGVAQTGGNYKDGLNENDYKFLMCLVDYMTSNDADWAVWGLQGSYYVRDGTILSNESFGILNFDWGTWRNPKFPGLLGAMWNVTQGPRKGDVLISV